MVETLRVRMWIDGHPGLASKLLPQLLTNRSKQFCERGLCDLAFDQIIGGT
ncbi:hypothetical protein D1872_324510 [compost metagenome]